MSMTHKSYLRALAASLLGTALFIAAPASAQQVKADEIGGVVTGAKGPEAGVWVIAETKDLRLRSRRFAGWRSPSLSRGNAERKKNENDEYFGEDSQLCSSSFVVNS